MAERQCACRDGLSGSAAAIYDDRGFNTINTKELLRLYLKVIPARLDGVRTQTSLSNGKRAIDASVLLASDSEVHLSVT